MALSQIIEVYQGNSISIDVTISGMSDLVGYTSKLIVKKNKEDDDGLKKFEATGTNVALVATFATSAANNTLDAGDYYYEVYITNGTNVFTVVQDIYRVLESVKY
jgi:hypothetical protein